MKKLRVFSVVLLFILFLSAGCKDGVTEPEPPAETVTEKFFYVYTAPGGDRNIACMNHDGTSNTFAAYSVDAVYLSGKVTDAGKIYYTLNGEYSLYEMDAASFSSSALSGFTSDYQVISTCKSGATAVFSDEGEIFKTALSSSSDVNLTNSDPAYEYSAAVSADGSRVAYLYENSLWVMNSDGTNKTELGPGITDYYVYGADWSPDGSKIAYICHNTVDSVYEIRVMNSDGTGDHIIAGSSAETFMLRWLWRADVLVFDRYEGADDTTDLYSINPGGTGIKKLTSVPAGGSALLSLQPM